MSKANFKAFDPVHVAELAINYLKNMTDDANDYLPYWLVLPHKKPAEAAHCKVDDAELVAVIAAAIAAAEGTSTDSFVVRSIRRRPSNKWKA